MTELKSYEIKHDWNHDLCELQASWPRDVEAEAEAEAEAYFDKIFISSDI